MKPLPDVTNEEKMGPYLFLLYAKEMCSYQYRPALAFDKVPPPPRITALSAQAVPFLGTILLSSLCIVTIITTTTAATATTVLPIITH